MSLAVCEDLLPSKCLETRLVLLTARPPCFYPIRVETNVGMNVFVFVGGGGKT